MTCNNPETYSEKIPSNSRHGRNYNGKQVGKWVNPSRIKLSWAIFMGKSISPDQLHDLFSKILDVACKACYART